MYSWNDVPQDVYRWNIGAYASLEDLSRRRLVTRTDNRVYEEALRQIGPDWHRIVDQITDQNFQILHDWLRIYSGTLTNPREIYDFLIALAQKEGFRDGKRTLVEVALAFPNISNGLYTFFVEKTSASRTVVTLKEIEDILRNLIASEGLATRTILPFIAAYPTTFRTIYSSTSVGDPIGKARLLELMERDQLPISHEDHDSIRWRCYIWVKRQQDTEWAPLCQKIDTYPYVTGDLNYRGIVRMGRLIAVETRPY